MRLRIFVVWMLALATAYSNSIVAWDFPIAGYQEGESKRKLDAPPEPSIFFNQGDVLYEITTRTPSEKFSQDSKPEWLIWNETTGMMVGKGSWQALYLLADKLRTDKLPMSPKVTFNVFEFPAGGQVAADAAPACSFSAVSRNGDQFTLKHSNGPWLVDAIGQTQNDESRIRNDIRLGSTLAMTLSRGDERWVISTTLSSEAGSSVRLGRSVHQGQGIEVRAIFQLVLPDGRLRADDIFEEKHGKAQRLDRALVDAAKTPAGWFKSARIFPQTLSELAPGKFADTNVNSEADPFAEKPTADEASKPTFPFPLIEFPAETNKWAGRPLWDISEILKSMGILLEPGDKVGYDPLTDQLCMFSNKESRIDLMESILYGCFRYSRNIAVSITDHAEELSVTTRNHENGFISHTKGAIVHSIEAATKYGEVAKGAIEIALEMNDGNPQNAFKATNIVWDGKSIPLGQMNANGGTQVSWFLKADLLPLEIHP